MATGYNWKLGYSKVSNSLPLNKFALSGDYPCFDPYLDASIDPNDVLIGIDEYQFPMEIF